MGFRVQGVGFNSHEGGSRLWVKFSASQNVHKYKKDPVGQQLPSKKNSPLAWLCGPLANYVRTTSAARHCPNSLYVVKGCTSAAQNLNGPSGQILSPKPCPPPPFINIWILIPVASLDL